MEEQNQTSKVSWWVRAIFGKDPRKTLVRISVWVVVLIVVFKVFLMPVRIAGLSMHPNYQDGKVRFINQLAYKWAEPKRGDVVAIRREGEGFLLLKRIVGLPGEEVSMVNGTIFINGKPLDEPYLKSHQSKFNYGPEKLKEDYYFVIGDNRKISAFAPEHRRKFIGKVLF